MNLKSEIIGGSVTDQPLCAHHPRRFRSQTPQKDTSCGQKARDADPLQEKVKNIHIPSIEGFCFIQNISGVGKTVSANSGGLSTRTVAASLKTTIKKHANAKYLMLARN